MSINAFFNRLSLTESDKKLKEEVKALREEVETLRAKVEAKSKKDDDPSEQPQPPVADDGIKMPKYKKLCIDDELFGQCERKNCGFLHAAQMAKFGPVFESLPEDRKDAYLKGKKKAGGA